MHGDDEFLKESLSGIEKFVIFQMKKDWFERICISLEVDQSRFAIADAIHAKWQKRKLKVSIIGLSDIVYNDILLMDKTFGFDTAMK
ncbi:6-phosphofructokinase 5, chloroplastic [Triticum urartu]|uniref:6-phosphofructokinase 5, chloroplastic n=1 Tax=Triticum urartu TaxID=4572 RepID=M7ZQM8_TRIUA|nr:6-phosphofructokinase 5, chloroplastic [Triticum urartu]